jgi:hypothetical protein
MLQDLLLSNSSLKLICGTAHRLTIWQSGDQSVMKGCVRGNQISFSRVSRFSSKEFSCNCTTGTALSFGTADVLLAAIGQ